LKSSSVFTAPPLIPEPAWASLFASGSSNAPADASGLSPSSAEVRRFSLRSRAAKSSGQETSERPVSIFLAEDNPADAGLVRRALEEHGVEGELIVIADGEKAIEFIQALDAEATACPDLAIVDLTLPKKPGREVLERMRLSERCGDIPVIILSSSDAERDKADAVRLGASRYIRKPSKLDDFLNLGVIFKAALSEPGR
jgi:chemotaxis family two-component system response regulator Rcp1